MKAPIFRQVSMFALVGLLATAVYLLVANGLIFLTRIDAKWASVIGYGSGMVISFAGQSRLTFGVRNADRGHITRFVIVSAAGLLVSYFSVLLVSKALGLHPAWATVVTVAVVPLASFFAMKLWVLTRK